MGKHLTCATATFVSLLGFVAPSFADDLLAPPRVPSAIADRYTGPVALTKTTKPVEVVLPVLAPGSKAVDVTVAPGVTVDLKGSSAAADKWLARVCEELFKDLTGETLPAAARTDPEKAFKEFKKEHQVHESGDAPKGALVFFKDKLAVSNGDGTAITASATGKLEPSVSLATLGKPLGWAKDKASGGNGSTDHGANGGSTGSAPGRGGESPGDGGGSGTGSSVGGGGGGQTFTGGSNVKLPAALHEIVVRALKADGLPASWADSQGLAQILSHESSFSSTAQNPSSTAYGLFQFLDSTWGTVGATKTSDPYLQCVAGLKYIKERYGNPDSAWTFWQAHHWY